MRTLKPLIGAAVLVLVTGCASRPPRELLDARAAYNNAHNTPGAALTPNDQREAKLALDAAEREFDEEGDEQSSRDLAYVAQRKAVAARAHSEAMQALEEKKIAQRDFEQYKASRATATAQELDRTKKSLEGAQAEAQSERAARNAALEKIAGLQAKPTERGLVLTLSGSVLFATGKSVLLSQAEQRLREVATALQKDPRHVTIVGHTDSKGRDDANQRLSEARANAVRTFLTKEGVPADRVSTIGMGESQPVADNETTEGRANNRRVELILEDQAASPPGQQPMER
jgi:outer membrane protein OmpA-like peptidoglycan-associated protein